MLVLIKGASQSERENGHGRDDARRRADFTTSRWIYPARQSLGGALLAAQRYAEAEQYFREDLNKERFPDNGRSYYGLAISLRCLGKPWQESFARYQERWKGAPLTLGDMCGILAAPCATQ